MNKRKAFPMTISLAKMAKRKENGNTAGTASFLSMLRYADSNDWCLLCAGLAASVFVGLVPPLTSLIYRNINDVLMRGQAQYSNGTLDIEKFSTKITVHVWQYFLLGTNSFIFANIMMASFSALCERQVHKIRMKLFEAILNQDIEWFESNGFGSLTEIMSSGIEKIKQGASDKVAIALQAMSTMVATVVIALTMSWKMTLVMLITAPFIVLSFFGSFRAMSASMRTQAGAYSSAGAVAEEVIGGIRTVASFNAQFLEIERYEKLLRIGQKMGIKKAMVISLFQGLNLMTVFVSAGIMFWYGTILVLDGQISPGTVLAVFMATLLGSVRVGLAFPQINVIIAAKLAAGEIFKIIDQKPVLNSSDPSRMKPDTVNGRLKFSNVHFSYPSRPSVKVLNGVSFTVEAGQKVALVGPSGCGKSTIISLLMRYYKFNQGSLTLDGICISDLNTEWIRNTVGIVSQESVLFATTVAENIRMGKEDATIEEMIDACKVANAHEFILKLPEGYNTFVGKGGIQLSGGQKQRLAIARAIIRHPKILLLDEATSALDTVSDSLVQKALDVTSSGRTMITVAHRLSTIRNSNKIIVLDKGKVVECGTHDELMDHTDGMYRNLVMAQEIASEPKSNDHLELDAGMARESFRTRRSSTSIKHTKDSDKAMEKFEEKSTRSASIMDILSFSRPELSIITAGCLLAIIRGASWPLFSIILGRIFTAFSVTIGQTGDVATGQAITSSIAFAVLGLICGSATFSSGALMGMAGEKMTMRLRLAVFKNILRQDGSYFDAGNNSTGKLTSRLATDASNVQAAIDQRLADVLQSIVSLIAGCAVAFFYGWNVAIIGIAAALVMGIFQTMISKHLKRRTMQDMILAEEATQIAAESIGYVRTIQSMNLQKSLYNAFCASCQVPHRLSITRGLWQSLFYAISTSTTAFNYGVINLFGLFMIRGGYTTPYAVFQVIEALTVASITVMLTAAYFPEFLRAKVSAELMFRMMRKEPKIDSLSDKGLVAPIRGNVDVSDVHFAYQNGQRQLVLNGIKMSASLGKTVALVGPSGCGKSTVIHLLERFYDALGGNIRIDGIDIRKYNIRHIRNAMAMVEQEPTVFNLSIGQNIAYGLKSSQSQVEAAAKLANIHAFVESLPQKYDTMIGPRGVQLSGGQKQRIAIARAVIRNPQILLLDEATSALDTESEKVVQEALDRVSSGRTCIVIAHRLSTIQSADVIIVMKDGRVAETGNHQELLHRKGLYYRLVQKQSK
ncbi:ABC transporter transmembrane region domain-containing protein [Ditylenchus destructor]|uniref:ABC-type xenobiotic transporter n=1 Tax=Ditylenchus destructor TaxID=166010 RepID=A0AAD4MZY2_9BILA|nr:ABC transporter transmembrane region domain-containing protein [Ditylenchus destructor]